MLLKTKLKNSIDKFNGNYVIELKNIIINGSKRGCSGFISNPENGIVVYVNTEKSVYGPLSQSNLFRYAKNNKDFGGTHSFNLWAKDDELAGCIHRALQHPENYERWLGGKFNDFI